MDLARFRLMPEGSGSARSIAAAKRAGTRWRSRALATGFNQLGASVITHIHDFLGSLDPIGAVPTFWGAMISPVSEARGGYEIGGGEGAGQVRALAERLAHDFTNQFGVIRSFAELAAEDVGSPERLREDLASIQEAAERGIEMTGRLRALDASRTGDEGEPSREDSDSG